MGAFSRLKKFFLPDAVVPEREEKHDLATDDRDREAAKLRVAIRKNKDLEDKIAKVTESLLEKDDEEGH